MHFPLNHWLCAQFNGSENIKHVLAVISQGALKKFSQPFSSAEPPQMQTEVSVDKSSRGSLSKSQDVLHFCPTITESHSFPSLPLTLSVGRR